MAAKPSSSSSQRGAPREIQLRRGIDRAPARVLEDKGSVAAAGSALRATTDSRKRGP